MFFPFPALIATVFGAIKALNWISTMYWELIDLKPPLLSFSSKFHIYLLLLPYSFYEKGFTRDKRSFYFD